jgi:spore coat protein U-like protein
MKANRIVLKVIAAAVLASTAGLASAAGNTTLNVTATVSAVCKFTAATMTDIGLGTIDPSAVAAAVTGTSDITYKCTRGTTPVVTITGGGTRTLTSGANTIAYTFSLGTHDQGTGYSAAAAATKVVATASIAQAAAQDAAAGAYSDTVTLSINN